MHRDLNPENILLGDKSDSHSVYLIDFGLVTPSRPKATKRRKIYNGLVGTAKFSAKASHEGLEQFPTDDLESLGYVLAFFAFGCLPWDVEKGDTDEELFRKILKSKKETTVEELSGGYNCLRKYFQVINDLPLCGKIDYS